MTRRVSLLEAANALGISPGRLRVLCAEGRVRGAERIGRAWVIPVDEYGMPATRDWPLKLTGVPVKRIAQ